ncbi:hypothetical protein F5890DRAFT_1478535 [Lentinula detonsa]|uniref:Protein kinase domain-containing protein n=1 Tax=Lentinula detonsa TaxID=2804962 RepID=A0AA38PPR1_9AGAR|nr:hypothetical protein F5890DRAFT_1478535 [Lentinula detonsa]
MSKLARGATVRGAGVRIVPNRESYFLSQAYKQTHKKARGALLQSVKEKVCEEVARVASTTGILHYDNQPDNILITFSKDGSNVLSVQLIDYGPPYTYAVDTSRLEAMAMMI